jgi:hypothetical protein
VLGLETLLASGVAGSYNFSCSGFGSFNFN